MLDAGRMDVGRMDARRKRDKKKGWIESERKIAEINETSVNNCL